MKYCPNCGTQLENTAKFCHSCGTPVPETATAAPPAAPVSSADSAPVVPPARPAPAAAQTPAAPASAAQTGAPQAPTAPADVARAAAPAPAQQTPTTAAPQKQRWGVAAQFPAVAAGQRPQASHFTYFYGFFQLLYHKSYRLFSRTYLPCCLLLIVDIGLLAYALTVLPAADTLAAFSFLFLLVLAIWFVVVSFWLSRYYAQELYKQVQGDADHIPTSILPPVLGGIALVALSVLAFVIGLAASSLHSAAPEPTIPQSTVTEPAPEEPLPAEEAPAAETPAPTEESAPVEETAPAQEPADGTLDLSGAVPSNDECWITTADEPWKGAWYCEAEYSVIIFESSSQYEQCEVEQTPDGGYRIACYDARDGSFNNSYELSADQSTLTEFDMDGNLVKTYRRPQFSEAYSPLPQDFWGVYTHVEGDSYLSEQGGPQENFVVDAFRFGSFGYQEVTDNGDGTYTFFLLMAPEGGYVTISAGTYEGASAFALYDNTGNVTDVYLRTATVQ